MRKVCVFSFARIYPGSMVASQRIARMVAEKLGVEITTDLNIDKQKSKLDLLVIINGAYGFCRCLPALGDLVRDARRVVWVQNDYTIIPPKSESGAESPFRLAFRQRRDAGLPHIDYWTTCADESKATKLSHYVNWNALTFDATQTDEIVRKRRRKVSDDDLFYYGSYREFRLRYFDRYFAGASAENLVTISSPFVKGVNRFSKKYPGACHVDKMEGTLSEELGSHGLGLYIEDKKSHSLFHSPANRFYEMLSAGLPMVFQSECGSMMRRAGYDPTPYQADNWMTIKRFMRDREGVLERQRESWLDKARADHESIEPSLSEAVKKMEKAL